MLWMSRSSCNNDDGDNNEDNDNTYTNTLMIIKHLDFFFLILKALFV